MDKYSFYNIVIELTRRCNMKCSHCLRGEAQNIDLNPRYLDLLFQHVAYISDLTLTGGEPSLVPHLIMEVIESLKRNNIAIGRFYIATNGKLVTDDFLRAIMELYLLCDESILGDEIPMLQYTLDPYHDTISEINKTKLEMFKFCSPRTNNGKFLLHEGRAKENSLGNCPVFLEEFILEDETVEGTIYLNSLGHIIAGCDWSYESQHNYNTLICDVSDFSIEKLLQFNERDKDDDYTNL